MATEKVEIFNVDTGEAVKSVGELKDNIKLLKAALDEQTIGTEEYQNTLQELKVNQNALRDAMFATSASMEDVAASAKGVNVVFDENNKLINQENQSYNALVHRMAELKQEWRATTDEVKRGQLGEQIDAINDRLKELDASVGNYQRNVGNYGSVWKDSGDALKKLAPVFGKLTDKVEGTNKAMGVMAKNPLMAVIVFLLPVIQQIAGALKDNETAMASVKKLTEALKPIAEFFKGILQKIAEWLGKVVEWFVGWFPKFLPILSSVVSALSGVGNALLQYLLTPIRTAIEAFKGLGQIMKDVFSGNFSDIKKDAEEAWDAIKGGFVKGVSFKQNFMAGKAAGEAFIGGLGSSVKSKAGDAGTAKDVKEAADVIVKEFTDEFDEMFKKWLEEDERAIADEVARAIADAQKLAKSIADGNLAELERVTNQQLAWNDILVEDEAERARRAYEIQAEANEKKLELLRQAAEDALAAGDAVGYFDRLQQAADLEVEIAQNKARELNRIEDESAAQRQKRMQENVSQLQAVAGATASILGTIADAYENDEKNAEKNAKKVKALRISEALINTISGAVGAFTQASATIPPPAGQIIGALTAAAVTASGMAQIAQIRKTQIGSGASSASAPLSVSAPALSSMPQNVRNVTSQSEEERLNRMASDQRVVLVQSDLEVASEQTRVQIAESTF